MALTEIGPREAPTSAFVGRTVELARVAELVSKARLVTLTGAPGVGKSALARRLGLGLESHSVVLVPLAGTAPCDVVPALAAALGDAGPDHPVVIADDCDLVGPACADAVAELLARSHAIRVIATSRHPLGLGAATETVWRVPSLSVPEPGEDELAEAVRRFEAVELFCHTAAGADPHFALTDANAPTVAEICRRLDGLPLALELAAGRVGRLSPDAILARLDDPDGLFALLVDESERRPPRHRSLRAAIEWSVGRLSGPEAVLWRRLSVFPGGFTAEAAGETCQGAPLGSREIPALLSELAGKSLVVEDGTPGSAGFRLLYALRRLAGEALVSAGEADEIAERHATWCVALVEAAGDPRRGRSWLEALGPYDASIEAALAWAWTADRPDMAVRLAPAHVVLCWESNRQDGAEACLEKLIALADTLPAPQRAAGLRQAGLVAGLIGSADTAAAALRRSVVSAQAAGDHAEAARALGIVSFVSMLTGDDGQSLAALDERAAVAASSGDSARTVEALLAAGRAQVLLGDPAVGHLQYEQALGEARQAGDLSGAAAALVGMGWASLVKGDRPGAECSLTEGLTLAGDAGASPVVAMAQAWLGELARVRGNAEEAWARFDAAAALARQAGEPCALGRALLGLGRLALARSDVDQARSYFHEVLAIARHLHVPFLAGAALTGLEEASTPSARTAMTED